jgi:fructokinase
MTEAQDRIVAGVELGGTKSIVLIGRGRDILVSERLPTTTPAITLAALAQRLAEWREQYKPEALGIGSFGPIALDKTGMDYGHMLATPKPGWAGADVAGALSEGFGDRVAIHTDVTRARPVRPCLCHDRHRRRHGHHRQWPAGLRPDAP